MTLGVLRASKDKCPYSQTKRAGDDSLDYCELNTKACLLESGLECDVYNDWLKDRVNE